MIEIRLPSWKHSIRVDSFYMDRTYGGMLEGRPDAALNERLVAGSTELVERLWGKGRPVHVIPPASDYRDPEHPLLPGHRCVAWLDCFHPVHDEEEHGSHLFVVWFQNEGCFSSDAVEFMLRGLDWKALAKDFSL
jgi:hypothetical protein